MTSAVVGEFRVGSVLGRGFSVFFNNFSSFMAIGLIVMVPIFVLGLMEGHVGTADMEVNGASPWQVAAGLLELFLSNLLTAAIVFGTIQELRGTRAGFTDCIGTGLGRLLPVVGVAVLAWLAIAVGFLLLVIPGFVVMTFLYVAIPVAVVERPGVVASLDRSTELTSGYRWKVFALILVMWGASLVLVSIVFFGLVAVREATGLPVPFVFVNYLLTVFVGCIAAVMATIAYHDLRAVKEGIDLDGMAAVFD